MKLRKVVFPVAGHGTRFLPATKATPKEMLTVVDKPLIQYAVEEALEAGFTDLIFITGKTKRTITDHFDLSLEITSNMSEQKKRYLIGQIELFHHTPECGIRPTYRNGRTACRNGLNII